MNNIAVLITCFNRKERTYQCLTALFETLPNCDVYLVDDGSTDNTSELIAIHFPQVRIIHGSGNLYWNRGMHLAWSYAHENGYDFYIWMNDDVFLYTEAITELLDCSALSNHRSIISGVIEDAVSGEVIYVGTDLNKRQVTPSGSSLPIHHLNGNVVLVPRYVYNRLGNLDPKYHHDLGDVDYGLRAKRLGISVLSTRKAIASGFKNSISRVRENRVTLKKRYEKLYSPLGSHPSINFYFRKRHYGITNACLFFLFQHFLVIIPDKVNELLFNNKYQ